MTEELRPIDRNLQYDFNYQQITHLEETTVLPVSCAVATFIVLVNELIPAKLTLQAFLIYICDIALIVLFYDIYRVTPFSLIVCIQQLVKGLSPQW